MLNPEAQVIFDQIVIKEVEALSEQDIIFLKARSSYLSTEQAEKFAEVLEAKVVVQKEKNYPAIPQDFDFLDFEQLKELAKTFRVRGIHLFSDATALKDAILARAALYEEEKAKAAANEE